MLDDLGAPCLSRIFQRKSDDMPDNLISVIDLATHHGIHKQTVFKVLKRFGIEPTKRRGANNRGWLSSLSVSFGGALTLDVRARRGIG